MVNQDPPATCAPEITAAVAEAAQVYGLSTKHMVSRAYHDSLFMARYVSPCLHGCACMDRGVQPPGTGLLWAWCDVCLQGESLAACMT